jgi:hypothetical protein
LDPDDVTARGAYTRCAEMDGGQGWLPGWSNCKGPTRATVCSHSRTGHGRLHTWNFSAFPRKANPAKTVGSLTASRTQQNLARCLIQQPLQRGLFHGQRKAIVVTSRIPSRSMAAPRPGGFIRAWRPPNPARSCRCAARASHVVPRDRADPGFRR